VPDAILAARRAARRARRAARAEAQDAAPPPEGAPAAPEPAAPPPGEKPNYAAIRAARRAERAAERAAGPMPDPETTAALDPEAEDHEVARPGRRRRRGKGRRAEPILDPEEIALTIAAQPEVRPAKAERRHLVLGLSFLALVILPALVVATYLYTRAADQYHSSVAFSIRSEEGGGAASGILGALTSMGSGSASDTDILFEFIRSQKIVEEIDHDLDLRAIYNRAPSDGWFSLGENPSIEALHAQWLRMVDVSIGSAGIIEVSARAFDPEDAKHIAEAILTHSSTLVNRLSEQARSDAIHFADGARAQAEGNLREMRQKMNDFRRQHRLVDPSADAAGQAGLLNALQSQLAQVLVDRDMLRTYASDTDQRMIQANRRIDAITERIDEERGTLGVQGVEGSLPDVLSAYEELRVDLEFANTAYTQALAGLAAARAEAGRQSRYLAPHIQPTLAETSLYPRRAMISGLTLLFLTLGWGILMLIYYNVRDNR
jgi:capsular polysaccharide transport system permease protein